VDIPNGGYALVMGNVMMQGPNALNNNCIGYGLEGLSNTAPHEFNFINNTVVNKRTASCNYVQLQSGVDIANITNNIFAGDGNELVGTATNYANNYYTDDISTMNFADELHYDYRLLQNSPAIDSGLTQAVLVAEKEYVLNLNKSDRPTYGSSIDIGAYEFFIDDAGLSVSQTNTISVFPNPTKGLSNINTESKIIKITVYDISGAVITKLEPKPTVNLEALHSGIYFLEIETLNGKTTKKIVKK
jgi:hypothetical protein